MVAPPCLRRVHLLQQTACWQSSLVHGLHKAGEGDSEHTLGYRAALWKAIDLVQQCCHLLEENRNGRAMPCCGIALTVLPLVRTM